MNVIKRFIFLTLIFSCLLNQAVAKSEYDIYQKDFSPKNTGVYEKDDWVFFVVKQQCLSKKKYAGTAESKAAEKTFYLMLKDEIVKRGVSFSSDIEGIGHPLNLDIKKEVSKDFTAQSALKHKLLFDRNSETDPCTQEYVVVLDRHQFNPNGVTIPTTQVETSAVNVILSALKREDLSLTKQYLENLGHKELAEIYKLASETQSSSVNLNVNDLVEPCTEDYCAEVTQPFSAYDINKVLGITIKYKGFVKITNFNPSVALAEILYQQAKLNFSQGKNANAIIQDLTLALNLVPQDAKSWKMLADISRAIDDKELEHAAAVQFVLHHPKSPESWVYLYLSYKEVDPKLALDLKRWLKIFEQKISFSSWAKKQISGE